MKRASGRGRGGARPGAGRKPQSKTIKKVSPEVINAGPLPLEMRLLVARHMWAEAVDASGKITDLAKAKEAAEFATEALPYTSGKLVAIQAMKKDEKPFDDFRQQIASDIDELISTPHTATSQAETRH